MELYIVIIVVFVKYMLDPCRCWANGAMLKEAVEIGESMIRKYQSLVCYTSYTSLLQEAAYRYTYWFVSL